MQTAAKDSGAQNILNYGTVKNPVPASMKAKLNNIRLKIKEQFEASNNRSNQKDPHINYISAEARQSHSQGKEI